jgi:catechol 2,3-dioxygenase-like lactoylglutathione lyase family enzyme
MINCIQQIGLGVANKKEAFRWIRKAFGMDIPIFDDEGEPTFMIDYTGKKLQRRTAVLAESIRGGSAFEIWQYLSRTPDPPAFTLNLGDLGIYLAKIKAQEVDEAYRALSEHGVGVIGEFNRDPNGRPHFFVKDPFGNLYQVIEDEHCFKKRGWVTGGVCGCVIGVSDIERSLPFYREVLGFDTVSYDDKGVFDDFSSLPGGTEQVRRVLLVPGRKPMGAFARLIGPGQIELVQSLKRKPEKIFENRFWGDLGFIHLCFDVHDMQSVKKLCDEHGCPFTVDSLGPFDMHATGHFSYIEDPDGTLIEFVEVYRMSLLRNLNKRNPAKPISNMLLRLLALGRVKD